MNSDPQAASNSTPSENAPSLMPLETLLIPSALDGSLGSNRGQSPQRQLEADTDVQAIKVWLARFHDSKATFENYRKEAERLLLWACLQRGKAVSSLSHEDVLVYQQFLADPQPASRWCMRDGRKFARGHAEWRPFSGPLSASSQRQAMVILNALFSWLVQAGYLAGNPLSLARQRKRQLAPRVSRYLEDDLWLAVKNHISALPQSNAREIARQVRLRWIFSLLYLTGMRISEVINNGMDSFFMRRDSLGQQRWWLEIRGKGDKLRMIPVSDELMAELRLYRRACQLPAEPMPNENTPLLLTVTGKAKPMSRGALHAVIKQVFSDSADALIQQGEEFAAQAQRLTQASAHWLRHTAGSHMANQAIDLRHVRDNLGHASLSTTNLYLHSEDDARHNATTQKHKIGW